MRKHIRDLQFWFDYHIGYMLTNGNKLDRWEKNLLQKYPEKFNKKK